VKVILSIGGVRTSMLTKCKAIANEAEALRIGGQTTYPSTLQYSVSRIIVEGDMPYL
jgi:hypothetical protein